MILAIAGRRIDAADSEEPRFPLANVELVRQRVRKLLETWAVTGVVSSAACGADLIVLSEAGVMGLRRSVILPFDHEKFRRTSVIDRPGDWGTLYDQVLDETEPVIIDDDYLAVNGAILDDATSQAQQYRDACGAALIWNGAPRCADDATYHFGEEARARGIPVFEVLTI